MSLGQQLAPHLPFLRRYGRALTGSQNQGDKYVRATLEAIVAAPDQFPRDVDPRLGLYRMFQGIGRRPMPMVKRRPRRAMPRARKRWRARASLA